MVFSDGTSKEGGRSSNTNVYKVFNMLEDRTQNQISYYDQGVGTDWRLLTGNIGGAGISKNIKECYQFIFEHYEAGDSVFLFGFSRGAATVRSLSNFIHIFGVLPRSRPELIKRAWKIYKVRNRRKRDAQAAEFIHRHHTMWCRIKFLGVWDTVAALGFPIRWIDMMINLVPLWRHKFQDFRLSDSVENARQAIAVDDERLTFHPVLWKRELQPYQSMKQVWFCGMHTDVGGGYPEPELSDIPLLWMLEEARSMGALVYPRNRVETNPDPNGMMHDSRAGLSRFYRRRVRSWDQAELGLPTVHESVLLRTLSVHNTESPKYQPWILGTEHEVEPWPENLRKGGTVT